MAMAFAGTVIGVAVKSEYCGFAWRRVLESAAVFCGPMSTWVIGPERGRLRDWVGRPLRPCANLGYGPWAGLWGYVSRPLRPSVYLGCGLWAEGGGLLSRNWRWSWPEARLSYGHRYC